MDELGDLTIRSATRLIKTHLRQFVYQRLEIPSDELSEEHRQEWLSGVLDYEKAIETAARVSWGQILELWRQSSQRSAQLEAYIKEALADAVEDSLATFREHAGSTKLIVKFANEFNVSSLLPDPG